MNLLPHWSLTGKHPAFYDTESATAIEQTAKVYGAMQTLIDEYNKFVDELNTNIQNFEESTTKDVEQFTKCMTNIMRNYTESMDMKINQAELYMKDNIVATTESLVNEAIQNGAITVIEQYDETTESLNMNVTGGV